MGTKKNGTANNKAKPKKASEQKPEAPTKATPENPADVVALLQPKISVLFFGTQCMVSVDGCGISILSADVGRRIVEALSSGSDVVTSKTI